MQRLSDLSKVTQLEAAELRLKALDTLRAFNFVIELLCITCEIVSLHYILLFIHILMGTYIDSII